MYSCPPTAGTPSDPTVSSYSHSTFLCPRHTRGRYDPSEFIDLFEKFYGPTMNAAEAARKNGKEQDKNNDAGAFIPASFMRINVSLRVGWPILAAAAFRRVVEVRSHSALLQRDDHA
jgi:hypothetical protein